MPLHVYAPSFTDHLKKFLQENPRAKENLQHTLNLTEIKKVNAFRGSLERFFDDIPFFVNKKIQMITNKCVILFKKYQDHATLRFRFTRELMHELLKEVCNELVDIETGFLKNSFLNLFDYPFYISAGSKKPHITQSIVAGYHFYLLSNIFINVQLMFTKEDLRLDFLGEMQGRSITCEYITGMRNYLKYSHDKNFIFLHDYILLIVNQKRFHFFAKNKENHIFEMLEKENPTLLHQLRDCHGYFKSLGESYAFAAKTVIALAEDGLKKHSLTNH